MPNLLELQRNDLDAAVAYYQAHAENGSLKTDAVRSLYMLQDDPAALAARLKPLYQAGLKPVDEA